MRKTLFLSAAAIALVATSCSQDEPTVSTGSQNGQINFTVTADKGIRSSSNYENGTDINKMYVSAWLRDDKNTLPGYGGPNTGNAIYFLNDLMTRSAGSGTFNYATDARYWPLNGEYLDFYAVVGNEAPQWQKDGAGKFDFTAQNGKPGLEGTLKQLQIDEMPDLLYATNFERTAGLGGAQNSSVFQKNVALDFYHAFAKVVVSAEVRNRNLRVYITDMEIHGIAEEGQFNLPYISGESSNTIFNPAYWTIDENKSGMVLSGLLKYNNASNPIILDMNEETGGAKKASLVGNFFESNANNNQLLVLPRSYSGRNATTYQTYILLKGYAYNIANNQAGFDEDTDTLIYPKLEAGQSKKDPQPAVMIIPIEFNWQMGTINYYNIVFDCGNGSSSSTNPNDPSFIKIGYEVEVIDWTTGEQRTELENGVDNSIEYPGKIKPSTSAPRRK